VRKGGERFWGNQITTAVRDEAGALVGFTRISRDLTARRQAEAALRTSEALLQMTVSTETVGVLYFRLDGRITDANAAFLAMSGYSRNELHAIGDWTILTPPEYWNMTQRAATELAARGETAPYEKQLIRKDGSRFWGMFAPTRLAGTGRDAECVEFIIDITARKEAEAALRQSEERYRLIVEQATDYAIFSTDPERRIETWPPGAARIFGWSAAEALGQFVDMTYTPEDQAARAPEQEARQARDHGQTPNVRWHMCKDGKRVFIDGMAYARRATDGTFQGVFKVGQDVTARILAEAARRTEEARMREHLEAEVASATLELRALSRRLLLVQEEERRRLALELHDEIGQVLTGLTFQLTAAQGQHGAGLAEASATVQALTEQVRQLSLELRPAVLDRYGLLAAVEWYVERFQQRTGVTVHLRHEELTRRFASEVEVAAFRVVQEALTNIARYAEVTEAWVTLFADDTLLVVIHDLGHGFETAQSGESNGLAGMRERVELLGGAFDLETAPGEGVHITAEFPLYDSAAARVTKDLVPMAAEKVDAAVGRWAPPPLDRDDLFVDPRSWRAELRAH
jgi:PAS domain S-box-containing protein